MARKNRTPEETARRAKIRELLQESNISSMVDIQNLFKETIAEFMENGLDGMPVAAMLRPRPPDRRSGASFQRRCELATCRFRSNV